MTRRSSAATRPQGYARHPQDRAPSLAEGATTAEILADFPTLSEEDVRAAITLLLRRQEDLPLAETPVKR